MSEPVDTSAEAVERELRWTGAGRPWQELASHDPLSALTAAQQEAATWRRVAERLEAEKIAAQQRIRDLEQRTATLEALLEDAPYALAEGSQWWKRRAAVLNHE